ncbi:MAG: choice-of-anchor D domain-containing protein [Acidobacteria bacterium]|nr:MAG: choice-of-anchor D domain-containing protein [Acidobacteriota bacterium]
MHTSPKPPLDGADQPLDLPLDPTAPPPPPGSLILDRPSAAAEEDAAPPPAPAPARWRGWPIVLAVLIPLAAAVAWVLKPDPPLLVLSAPLLDFGSVRLGSTSPPLTLTVENRGERPLELGPLAVAGDAAADVRLVAEDCSGRVLDPGETCIVRAVLEPTARGRRLAELRIAGELPASPRRVPLIGDGIAPRASVEPREIDFGEHTVGHAAPPAAVVVRNLGTSPLRVEALVFEGLAAGDFALHDDRCSAAPLAPLASCRLELVFVPTAAGRRQARAWLRSDAPEGLPAIELAGQGLAPAARLTADAASLDLGAQALGEAGPPRTLTLTNAGTAPLTVTSVEVVGAASSRFAVDAAACTAAPLAPQAACTLAVTFRPDRQGPAAATLRIHHDAAGSPHEVPLSGLGLAPGIRVRPPVLELGEVPVGSRGGAVAAVIENTGLAPLRIASAIPAGDDARAFEIAGDGCSGRTLAPETRCEIAVRLRPRRGGSYRGELVVRHNAGDPERIPLAGTGLAPQLAVTPEGLDFGTVVLGAGRELRLELISRGRAPLRVDGLRLAGRGRRHFALVDPGCTRRPLPPGRRCALRLRFAPTAVGEHGARLEIVHDGESGPASVPLVGRGAEPPRPQLAVEPESLDFGSRPIGSAGEILTLTIANAGDADLELAALRLAGPHAADFQLVPGSCAGRGRVPPAGSCTVGVRFRPSAAGRRGARLVIEHNAAGGSDLVPLTGVGEETPPAPG